MSIQQLRKDMRSFQAESLHNVYQDICNTFPDIDKKELHKIFLKELKKPILGGHILRGEHHETRRLGNK